MKSIVQTLGMACMLVFSAMEWSGKQDRWRKLDDGLHVAEFAAPRKSHAGNSKITVIRVDPERFAFRVFSAVQDDSTNLTVRQWCERHALVGAINAGMYAKDYLTHVGYMKNDGQVLNRTVRKDYKAALLCDPIAPGIPSAQLVDFECQDFPLLAGRYRTAVQNLRMISCRRANVWSQQKRRWSTAALGMDSRGNLLLIFCQSPYSVHDLNDMLLELPLDLSRAMYLEGGAPASLYMSYNGTTIERHGLYETGGGEGAGLVIAHQLPNVIGFARK